MIIMTWVKPDFESAREDGGSRADAVLRTRISYACRFLDARFEGCNAPPSRPRAVLHITSTQPGQAAQARAPGACRACATRARHTWGDFFMPAKVTAHVCAQSITLQPVTDSEKIVRLAYKSCVHFIYKVATCLI